MLSAEELSKKVTLLEDDLQGKSQKIVHQDKQISVKDQRIKHLEEKLLALRHRHFGASSEKLSKIQPELDGLIFDEAEALDVSVEEKDESIDVPAHKRKKKRTSLPDNLPRRELIHDLNEADKFCPHDGTALKQFSEETSEQLEYIPAKVEVLRHVRLKYCCPNCNQYVVTANKPAQPIEKSFASPGLLAHIATAKYCDALPLYRQVAQFKRIGIELDRTTMANWMIKMGDLTQSVINRLQEVCCEQNVLHMDETPTQVLNEPGKDAKTKSYMWVMTTGQAGPAAVLFHYSAGRSSETPLMLLDGFKGALMSDGYICYKKVCHDNELVGLGCWAHTRRYFMDAKRSQAKGKSGKVDQALSFIQKLYRVERLAQNESSEERYRRRQTDSLKIIDSFKKWLDKTLAHSRPAGDFGRAVTYLNNQWPKLISYLEDGAWPIDNNRAENAIRPFVIGRKNWLFSNSQAGATASANLYSLIESAKANDLEPYAYLKTLFKQLPSAESVDDIDALLPWNIANGVG